MEEGLVNQTTALQFMGERFRVKAELPDWVPDEIITKQLMKYVHVHSIHIDHLLSIW